MVTGPSATPAQVKLLLDARSALCEQRWADAGRLLERAVLVIGRHADVWLALAEVRHHLGNSKGSVEAAQMALARDPRDLKACLLSALGLMRLQRHAEAVAVFEAFPPELAAQDRQFHTHHGEALRSIGRPQQAIGPLMNALALKPDDVYAHSQLGFALRALGLHAEAAECFRTVTVLNPKSLVGHAYLVHWEQFCSRWDDFEGNVQRLIEAVHGAVEQADAWQEFSAPFVMIGLPHHPLDLLAAARLSARFVARGTTPLPVRPAASQVRRSPRLRIGYLSADFHTHATAMLLVQVLEQRDHERFEVVLFSHGADDRSPMRRRIEAACERFIDVRTMTARETAQRIHEEDIDILVDLKGYTGDNRLGTLAWRPAPLQATWLGFPGTTGADFIDYFIGDPVVTPLDHAPWYSETLAQMPVCYQPNDRQRVRPGTASRAEWGLPEDALVLASFNQPFKITPEVFDVWMDLLLRLPQAVLWQFYSGEQSGERLRAEAARRGVDPARIVFAPPVKPDAHLGRIPAADLVLDTWPCNGHTTTSDALWAGVPVVTLQQLNFASRVAASLLHAVGLDELVCEDTVRYRDTVLALAADPARRQALRQHLVAARDNAPLFDAARFAHDLEALYLRMWQRHCDGLAPQALPAQASSSNRVNPPALQAAEAVACPLASKSPSNSTVLR